MGINYKENGTIKNIKVKVGDNIQVGTIVEFDGTTIPVGWEEVEDKGEIYSTEETRIGTWIDGKPIYRKVISKTVTPTSKYTTLAIINNIDTITDIKGSILGTDRETVTGITWITDTNSPIQNWCVYFYTATSQLSLYKSADFNENLTVNITLEYTKTTD